MITIVPTKVPQITRAEVEDKSSLLRKPDDVVYLFAERGYYRDTMGKPGVNDRAIYDDSITLVSPTAFASFNANVDPSIFRAGIATLQPGRWMYTIGIHGLSKPPERRYKALVQAGEVQIVRDGAASLESGYFGINIHKGSNYSTSSEGCQTIYPLQWDSFINLVESEMHRHGKTIIPYILVENSTAST